MTVALLKLRGLAHAELEREVEVFVTLGKHPYLAALLGVTIHPDGDACMLVEYAPCGSLDKVTSIPIPDPYSMKPAPSNSLCGSFAWAWDGRGRQCFGLEVQGPGFRVNESDDLWSGDEYDPQEFLSRS